MADANEPKPNEPKADASASRWPEKVVIEIGDMHNRAWIFPLNKQTLRGAWKRGNVAPGSVSEEIGQMTDIPGMRIEIDCRARKGRIYDPLNHDKALLERLQVEHKRLFNANSGPEKDVEYNFPRDKEAGGAGDTQMKTWLYYMRRVVEGSPVEKHPRTDIQIDGGPGATVITGHLPNFDEIERLPGKIGTEHFNEGARKRRYRSDPEYADVPFGRM